MADVVCVVDLRPVPGRPNREWELSGRRLVELVDRCCAEFPHARRAIVDYGPEVARALGAAFLRGASPPAKTYRGGPFYAYLFGLHAARSDHVLHLDSDILFGGGSQTWVEEAMRVLVERPDALVCQPFPGPPRPGGLIDAAGAEREATPVPAYRFATITTRYFLIDLTRFRRRIGGLRVRGHSRDVRRVGLRTWLDGVRDLPFRDRLRPFRLATPGIDLPERLLGEAMAAAEMYRIDYLGRAPGMWTLHPLVRTAEYYEVLPDLVRRVEAGEVTDEQLGQYDVVDSMLRPVRRP